MSAKPSTLVGNVVCFSWNAEPQSTASVIVRRLSSQDHLPALVSLVAFVVLGHSDDTNNQTSFALAFLLSRHSNK